jgi:hypothetical protein
VKIILKKIKNTPKGRIIDEREAAVIEFNGESVSIKCFDRKIKENLQEIFSVPFTVRIPVVNELARGFVNGVVSPGTPQHFREMAYLLRKGNFQVTLME